MKRFGIYICVLLLGLGGLLMWWSRPANIEADFTPAPQGLTLIAHAGGGLDQGSYSNSQQAFDRSAQSGFTLIEADFNWTQNSDLVLARDWDIRHYRYFSSLQNLPEGLARLFPRQPKTAEDFMARSMHGGLTQMNLPALASWMDGRDGVRIITDIKGNNLEGLKIIADHFDNHGAAFIVQIYSLDQYEPAKALGFSDIIFTNYAARLPRKTVTDFAANNRLFAVTSPLGTVTETWASDLARSQTPLLTHTVNDPDIARRLSVMGISGIYTDYLMPARVPVSSGPQ